MTDNHGKYKSVEAKFQSILPKLWDKARENKARLKAEYIDLFFDMLRDYVNTHELSPSIIFCLDGITIEEFEMDAHIIFGTDNIVKKACLDSEARSLLDDIIKSITRRTYEISFVVTERY